MLFYLDFYMFCVLYGFKLSDLELYIVCVCVCENCDAYTRMGGDVCTGKGQRRMLSTVLPYPHIHEGIGVAHDNV